DDRDDGLSLRRSWRSSDPAGTRYPFGVRPVRSCLACDNGKRPRSPGAVYVVLRSEGQSATAAGATATFTDVAGTRRTHLRAAGETQRRIGECSLLRLDELRRGLRLGRRLVGHIGMGLDR